MNNDLECVLKIEKFDHEGRGIGYIDSKVVFVNNTVPGDTVMVQITKNKKNYSVAKVIKYLEFSLDRIKPICPYFNLCGGCDLQNINYESQLAFKENKVKEILSKFGSIDMKKVKPILADYENNFYYRNKLTFQVKKQIGLYARDSYHLVSVDKCYIASLEINNILVAIKNNVKLENIEQVVIRSSFYNKKTMVTFAGEKINVNNILKIKDSVNSIYIKENGNYKHIYGDIFIEEKLRDYIFRISPDSFFQVNPKTCVKLYDKIIQYGDFKQSANVLDLYCGTGTIGIYISKFVNKVIGYEINKYAISDALINKKNNLVDNIEFVCGSSELSFDNITSKVDVIIVDPPRNGLNKETIKGIISVKPCKVIYVSCDPVTLARDLKLLSDFYEIIEITPVDMFPNTKHVECVSLLKLKML